MSIYKIEIIKKLINHKNFCINHIDVEGNSFLHHSCINNNFQVMKLLINKNININIKNYNNQTALDILIIIKI